MEDKEKNKKLIRTLIILIVVFSIVTIGLNVFNKKNENKKALANHDYIIEKDTEYSSNELKGKLPVINLKGEEIDKINNEIVKKYYSVAYTKDDIYTYEYTIYENILSLFIKITYVDDTEYGTIEHYAYNINLDNNKPLTNSELVKELGLNESNINDEIDSRIKKYYAIDSLNKELSLEQYKEKINYSDETNKYMIKENVLYCYMSIRTTQSLVSYQGNLNRIELANLK